MARSGAIPTPNPDSSKRMLLDSIAEKVDATSPAA
jgi:hypothetical protein